MQHWPLRKKILWTAVALLTAVNIVGTAAKLADIYPRKKPLAHVFPGKKFEGLQLLLKNETYAGYYTDQDMDQPAGLMELLQAQHAVVPLLLDPGGLAHRYIIVNCHDIPRAIEKFQAMNARPVTSVNFGIFVVERPEFKP